MRAMYLVYAARAIAPMRPASSAEALRISHALFRPGIVSNPVDQGGSSEANEHATAGATRLKVSAYAPQEQNVTRRDRRS
jgi:hypothetical protein